MITNNESIKLDKRISLHETIGDISYSCSSQSIFGKYWAKQNLPMSETRKAEKRIPEETQLVFLQLSLSSRILPCSLYHKNEIEKMERGEFDAYIGKII